MAKTTSSVNYLTARRPLTGDPIAEPVTYDSQGRVVEIVYKVGQAGTAKEIVTFAYSNAGHIIYKGIEYPDHSVNIWEGTLIKAGTISNMQTRNGQSHARTFDLDSLMLLTEILYEIKKMNTQLALITEQEL
jgi:hypothetical protein